MILLDTNALLWLEGGHRRARTLANRPRGLYASPASVLELQLLLEAGRIRLRSGSIAALMHDPRWVLDEPPAGRWFEAALDFNWTRDPFDRLLAAHARLRGWRLATADTALLARLGERDTLEL